MKNSAMSFIVSFLFMALTAFVLFNAVMNATDDTPSSPYGLITTEMCFNIATFTCLVSIVFLAIGIYEDRSNNRVALADSNRVQGDSKVETSQPQSPADSQLQQSTRFGKQPPNQPPSGYP